MSIETLAVGIWAVWYATWLAAVVFSGRTAVQMKSDMGGAHRFVASVGALMLFAPTGSHGVLFGPRGLWPLLAPLWTAPQAVNWVLLGLTVGGFAFCWWARLHLGRLWSGLVTLKEDHHIVDTGPYALVRHPIYSGVMVSALMTALIKATPLALLGSLGIMVGFWMTAGIEERFLRAQLGEADYEAYSRRVGMLIPGLGRSPP
jgi:protein-S-isoprenylcysteine O-methyltransferase Ste14